MTFFVKNITKKKAIKGINDRITKLVHIIPLKIQFNIKILALKC